MTHEATERNTNEGGPNNDDENDWDKGHDSSDGDELVAWGLVFDEINTCRNEVVNTGY